MGIWRACSLFLLVHLSSISVRHSVQRWYWISFKAENNSPLLLRREPWRDKTLSKTNSFTYLSKMTRAYHKYNMERCLFSGQQKWFTNKTIVASRQYKWRMKDTITVSGHQLVWSGDYLLWIDIFTNIYLFDDQNWSIGKKIPNWSAYLGFNLGQQFLEKYRHSVRGYQQQASRLWSRFSIGLFEQVWIQAQV